MTAESLLYVLDRMNQMSRVSDLDTLFEQLFTLIFEVSGASGGTLYWLDQITGRLTLKCVCGDETSHNLLGRQVGAETGLMGEVIRARRPHREQASRPRDAYTPLGELSELVLNKVLAFPLLINANPMPFELMGCLQLFNYADSSLTLLQSLVDRMTIEIIRITELEGLKSQSSKLLGLIEFIGQIGSTLDRDQILRMIIDDASSLLMSESCSLFIKDEETGDSILHLASDEDPLKIEHLRVPAGKGIIGHTIQTGETILVADASRDERHYSDVDRKTGFVTRSLLTVPLRTRQVSLGRERGTTAERIIGALEAVNKIQGTFDDNDAQFLTTLANQAATVLQIAELYAEANELFLNFITAFAATIDAKDPYTEGHSQRVSEYAIAIARHLGLTAEDVHHTRIGALLHDIGKIGVPDAILSKPGHLTDSEYERMKHHPAIGQRIIGQVRMLQNEVPAIAEHHEWLDGSGYPRGLRGSQISLIGRIVAAADVFDALTSHRPYRGALSAEEAFQIQCQEIGNHFDGDCVEAVIKAYEMGEIMTQAQREGYG